MPIFRFRALNAEQQLVVGHVAADAVAQALAQLEGEGLVVQSIGFASESDEPFELGSTIVGPVGPVTPALAPPDPIIESALLESHLARVLEQCRPLVPALRAYAEEMPDGSRKGELQEVCHIIQHGDAAEAAADLAALPEYWIPLLSAAAQAGDAGRVLRGFLEESRIADELSHQSRKALIYPAVIVLLAGSLMTAFAFVVLPQFRGIFNDFDLELPRLTVMLLNVSEAITDGTVFWAVVAIGATLAALYALRHRLPASLRSWAADTVGFLFGRSTAIAQFTRFTADLLDAGMDVPSALRIAGSASRRPRMSQAGWQLAHALETNAPGIPYRSAQHITTTGIHILQSEMPLPSRVLLLKELSEVYANRAKRRVTWTYGIFEPLAIAVVGLFVGLVVVALFVPLVDLVNNLSG